MIYARLLMVLVALGALGYTHFKAYEKGKDSVIKGVLAGTAVAIKEQDKNTDAAIKQTATDTAKVAKLEKERNDLKTKLDAMAKANPRPSCLLSDDELSALNAAASETE